MVDDRPVIGHELLPTEELKEGGIDRRALEPGLGRGDAGVRLRIVEVSTDLEHVPSLDIGRRELGEPDDEPWGVPGVSVGVDGVDQERRTPLWMREMRAEPIGVHATFGADIVEDTGQLE